VLHHRAAVEDALEGLAQLARGPRPGLQQVQDPSAAGIRPAEQRIYLRADEGVSYGTRMGHDLQHYRDIPIQPTGYGQSLAILALVEGLRHIETDAPRPEVRAAHMT